MPPMFPTPAPMPVLSGLADDSLPTGVYFDDFDWDGSALDAEALSAEDFLTSLGS
jgi:hypothetical protein